MIPVHPQAGPDRPGELRWVTSPGILPFSGPVAAVPVPLAELLDDGTLAAVRLEPGAVVTCLGAARTWADVGGRVRTAVHAALEQPAGWRPGTGPAPAEDADPDTCSDARLEAAARDLLEGEVGGFARSHGGGIELLEVRDGVVRVRLDGACNGCPAARVTLQVRLDGELRRRCPDLREVRAVPVGRSTRPGRLRRLRPWSEILTRN